MQAQSGFWRICAERVGGSAPPLALGCIARYMKRKDYKRGNVATDVCIGR